MTVALILAAILTACAIGLILMPSASSNVAQAGFACLILAVLIVLAGVAFG
jgi:hypothetical protein